MMADKRCFRRCFVIPIHCPVHFSSSFPRDKAFFLVAFFPFASFLLRPGNTPDREQAIRQRDLITAVEIPALPRPLRSRYLKVRDRQS
jgi:hypothetical protein